MRIGILALQGAVSPHEDKLHELGAETVQVRTPEQLEAVGGIILPGGESTTMLHLLHVNKLWNPLQRFVRERPSWGVCAGSILLAQEVSGPEQASLQAMDIGVERNAYGRQAESFIAPLKAEAAWKNDEEVEGVFIRAPRFNRLGKEVESLFTYHGEPVMVKDRHLLASAFHPELSASLSLHRYFLDRVRESFH